jgi:alpha-1,6-mannosyltransferase
MTMPPHSPAAVDALPDSGEDAPLKVLDITDFYSEGASGGVKVYLREKSRHLREAGVEHVLVVPGESDSVSREGHTRVYRVAGPTVPVSPDYRVMTSVKRVRRILAEERPDVVEVGSPFIVPGLVRRAVRPLDLDPVLLGFYHADVVRTFAEPYVPHRVAAPVRVLARMAARALVRRVYRRLACTVAASASVADELRGLGVPSVRHVSLGVDLEVFRPLPHPDPEERAALGLPTGHAPIGLFVGRFCAEKRLDVLLDGHARLDPADRPHLVFVGDGPLADRLAEVSATRSDVTVLPYVTDREALAMLYNAADFYLAVGPGETFGLSIAEGIACGLPVVVVDRGAAPDRVAGADIAELYVHGEGASAADALRRMGERLAVADRDALVAAARSHAEREFDWRGTFAEMIAVYREHVAVRG